MTVGEKIKNERKKKGLTQEELSIKSFISRSYLANIERNKYHASLDTLTKIAAALSVPPSALLDDSASLLDLVAADNGMSAAFDLLQNAKQARPDDGDELDEVSIELVNLLTKLTPQEADKAAAYIQGLLAAREE